MDCHVLIFELYFCLHRLFSCIFNPHASGFFCYTVRWERTWHLNTVCDSHIWCHQSGYVSMKWTWGVWCIYCNNTDLKDYSSKCIGSLGLNWFWTVSGHVLMLIRPHGRKQSTCCSVLLSSSSPRRLCAMAVPAESWHLWATRENSRELHSFSFSLMSPLSSDISS